MLRADELRVVMPETVQTAMSGGDRYLAANIGTFRAVTLTTDRVDEETSHVLGLIQRTVSELNPRHEDNYYTAQAILPWSGEYAPTVDILHAANDARYWDVQATFYYAFDRYYFLHDAKGAADLLLQVGVPRTEGGNVQALRAIASKWYEHVASPQEGKVLLLSMRAQTRDEQLKHLIDARITRIDGLIALRTAATQFEQKFGRKPARIDELVSSHMIAVLPVDPLGRGYVMTQHGVPEIAR